MAENTLLQRENDYQNKREYLEHHSNVANTKLKKTISGIQTITLKRYSEIFNLPIKYPLSPRSYKACTWLEAAASGGGPPPKVILKNLGNPVMNMTHLRETFCHI